MGGPDRRQPMDEQMTHMFKQKGCRFCVGEMTKVVLPRPGFKVRQCLCCGVMWTDPLRFDEVFQKSDENAYLQVSSIVSKDNTERLREIKRYAHPCYYNTLLEIGFMNGNFLYQARQIGYKVHGLDLSESAVSVAGAKLGNCVEQGTLDETYPHNSVDIVAAFNVIEHMNAPDIFLNNVKRVLKPGGLLVLETPSQESLYHYIMFLRGRIDPDKKIEIGLYPGGHMFKFGKKAWRNILSKRGYTVVHSTPRSTSIKEVLEKKKSSDTATRIGIAIFGILGRMLGLGNRIFVIARHLKTGFRA